MDGSQTKIAKAITRKGEHYHRKERRHQGKLAAALKTASSAPHRRISIDRDTCQIESIRPMIPRGALVSVQEIPGKP